jgi:excisionase family DNA binding protein
LQYISVKEREEEELRKMAAKKALTVPETATVLGITERAAWQRIYRKQLPHRRWGRRVLIPTDELEEFLKALPGISAEEAATKVEGEIEEA